jgi:hypothetical protein
MSKRYDWTLWRFLIALVALVLFVVLSWLGFV